MRKKDKRKEQKELVESYSYVLQFGLNMIVPIFGCTLLGGYLDDVFSTSFLAVIGFILGALAGYTSIYKMVKKMLKKEKGDEKHP